MDIIKKYSKTHRLQKQNYTKNRWKKKDCPMRGVCLTENVLYYAKMNCDDEKYKLKLYEGICGTTFKKRYTNYKKSFNMKKTTKQNKNDTKLSTE